MRLAIIVKQNVNIILVYIFIVGKYYEQLPNLEKNDLKPLHYVFFNIYNVCVSKFN